MNLLVYFLMKQIFLIEFSVKNVALSFKKKKKRFSHLLPSKEWKLYTEKLMGLKLVENVLPQTWRSCSL